MSALDQATSSLAAVARWRAGEYVFWAAALASLVLLPDWHLLLNEAAIMALFALSLDLVLGYGGIVSLGHAAFFGFGAYAAGMLARAGWAEPLSGLLVAGAGAGALGFLSSFLVLRGSDLTRIMVTLSVASVLFELANRFAAFTGGADGLQGITIGRLPFGFDLTDLYGTTQYGYSLVVLFIAVLLARRLVFSPFGWSVRAVKGNALRTAAIGIPVSARLVAIYTIGACYAGLAGGLLAQTTQFVSLDVLAFHRSAEVLLMLVVGGTGYLYGGPLGAVGFKIMQDRLATLTPQYWQFWIGFLLVLLVLVGRERIAAGPRALLRRLGLSGNRVVP